MRTKVLVRQSRWALSPLLQERVLHIAIGSLILAAASLLRLFLFMLL